MAARAVAPANREKRQRQKNERRDAILDAARKVFAQKGYDGATMADIGKEAGIAAGTVYLYFASKTDLFAALNLQLYNVINQALEVAEAPPDLVGAIRVRIQGAFQAARQHSDLVRLVFVNPDPRTEAARRMQRADEERLRPLAELLRAGMEAGVVRSGDPYLLARIINGLVIMELFQCFVQSDGRLADTYQDTITDMVVAALRPN